MSSPVRRPRSPRLPRLGLFVLLSGCAGIKDDTAGGGALWRMADQGLGLPLASGTDADIGDGPTAWAAAAQAVPGIDWRQPLVEAPVAIWDELQTPRLSDAGSCPYATADGGGQLYRSDCRTSGGYEWRGTVREEAWEDEQGRWRRWDFDLEVVADTDDPAFTRVALEGAVVYVDVDGDEAFATGAQANWRIEADGFWARRAPQDSREALWQTFALNGRDEADAERGHRIELASTVAGIGSYTLASDEVVVDLGCSAAPTGTVALAGRAASTLRFGDTCAQCAAWEGSGAASDEACAN